MLIIERIKAFLTDQKRAGIEAQWGKISASLKKTFKTRRLLLFFIPLFVVPFSVLKTLGEDGEAVFAAQKGALVLEVFSRTDLAPEDYALLEENLKALESVKGVVAVSPEESLSKITLDPKLGIDPQWLQKKKEDLKGKDTLLPWSYNLYLSRWDENNLARLTLTIQNLEVGKNKIKAVAEIQYDRERWSLAFALFNYVRWLKRVLGMLLCLGLGLLGYLAIQVRKKLVLDETLAMEAAGFFSLAILGGILSHLLFLVVLALSFFPETFSWKNQIGHALIFQIGLSFLFSFCAHAVLLFERRR